MKMVKMMLAGTAAVAALATAAPASAQVPYGYNPYNAYNPYAPQAYGYGYQNNTAYMQQVATQQCTAAVQNRLATRNGLPGIIGSLLGVAGTSPRVLSITEVRPRRSSVRVRGLASSGRYAYNPYGAGYYGAAGAGYMPDLQFRCDVDYRGVVRDVDINRR